MALIQTLFLIATIWIARWLWRSASFVTGNMKEVFNPNAWGYHQELVEKYDGGVIRINGLLGEQQLYIFDPKSLNQILIKDQDIFEEPSYVIKGTRVSFGEGLLSTLGEQHKKQRKMLNPVFSAAHLRQMVPIFFDVGKRLRDALESRVQKRTTRDRSPLMDDAHGPGIVEISSGRFVIAERRRANDIHSITTLGGSTTTELPVPAETGIFCLHPVGERNPAVWGPDALEWKPERWLSPLPQTANDFHRGGRACIGFKFSQLEMKVILCLLVERFKFSLSDKDIKWSMGSIAVPSVEGNKHELPLKVEIAA
ncbi:Docosahexaenoic acid omega-hydroxylase CYP4F3 [Mycena venus]|uniref:Docosahexaenoic acid omega-hydroxylase CYP4F3 n=1 Tax=Mycena venus TaxID=2733690 RepID=A0A8H6WS93_9AGAR|nr:Docosahexaenoic acid omega-hydroxylase CYP4F3 [Mycena venus]